MEEDLEHFLRSRGVPREDIMRMQNDKVDKAVLAIMSDEQMAKYITSYGDRLAVLSFTQQSTSTTDKETLLHKIRSKIGARKMKTKGVSQSGLLERKAEEMTTPKTYNEKKTTRKIEIGWLNFTCNEYRQVRTQYGGGTRHATMDKASHVSQILENGKQLFFPDGVSTKGRAEEFDFVVCDFKREEIALDVTIGSLYEQSKLKLLRFYICTKKQAALTHQSFDDDTSDEDVTPIDADEAFTADQEPGPAHSDITDQNLHFQMQPKSKKHESTSEIVTVQGSTKSHPDHSTPKDNTKTYIGQGQDTDSRDDDVLNHLEPSSAVPDSCFETIDLTSAVPESESNSELDTIDWDPEDDLGEENYDETDVITFHFVNNEDVTQSVDLSGELIQDITLELSSANDLPTPNVPSIHEAALQTAQDSGRTFSPQDFPSSSYSQPFSSTSAGNSEASPRRASICRMKVVADLVAVFMDSSILNLTLNMDFVNEKAIDADGVSREVYTAFWEQFLEQCEGESERVPKLRPDFSEVEWQAVGRIWVKGFLEHGVMPVTLSKAFILACIHGIDSVDTDILMSSFLEYLPSVERSAVEKALQGTMEESDEEELLDLFTRMGSHILPPKNNMEAAIKIMAHKAILQEPKYILDCFSTSMALVQIRLSDKQSVLSLYESKKATGKRVFQLLETSKVVLSQREQTTFNYLQRYVKNAEPTQAAKILRFCTGSSVICVDKILVCFNAETGLSRRPIGHTCGATLEVPYTYGSYPEFRTEFDNILSSNYLNMDIL